MFIVRHGETDFNVQKKMQGRLDIPLNATGHQQAKKLATRFADLYLDAIYSSDLIRARETAATVAKMKKLEIKLSELLRERNFGEAEGRSLVEDEELKKLLDAFGTLSPDTQWHSRLVSDSETNAEIVGRTFTYIRALALQHLGQHVLIVTHGGVMMTLLSHLGYVPKEKALFGVLTNTAIAELQSDGVNFTVKRVDGLSFRKP